MAGCHSLLDYGRGHGIWLQTMSSINPNFRYRVFDIDKDAEQRCKRLFPERYDEGLRRFDIIVVFAVLQLMSLEEQEHAFFAAFVASSFLAGHF